MRKNDSRILKINSLRMTLNQKIEALECCLYAVAIWYRDADFAEPFTAFMA
jgi:hypothetical protein